MSDKPSANLESLSGMGLLWNSAEKTLDCTSPHSLVRAAGYLKHVLGQDGARVLFRGQTEAWSPCLPSIYRGAGSQKTRSKRITNLKLYMGLGATKESFIKQSRIKYDFAHEPLLQHYGVRTRWLDVVDNVWVALWFGVFDCVSASKNEGYWHFVESRKPYAYILLMSPGPEERPVEAQPGTFSTESCVLADLRVAAPSLYVRPHAQHGLLMSLRSSGPNDYSLEPYCVGRIRVSREDGKRWLGSGFLHDPHVVFPPPHYDPGYLRFLEKAPQPPSGLGRIAHVFP